MWSVFFFILIGALAAGGSTGFFLYQANLDRAQQILRLDALTQQLEFAKQEQEHLTDETNDKIAGYTKTIQLAEQRMQTCEAQQQMRIVRATPLAKPNARILKNWKSWIGFGIGAGLRIPPGSTSVEGFNTVTLQTVSRGSSSTQPWLKIQRLDPSEEAVLMEGLKEPETVSYVAQGASMVGVHGRTTGNGSAFVLRVGSSQTPTHLVWAQTAPSITESRILEVLATLEIP